MIEAARIPAAHLEALAPLRADGRVRILRDGDRLWVRWPADLIEVVALLRPVPQVEFYEPRGGRWHRPRHRLASSLHPPTGDGEPLTACLAPARFAPQSTQATSIQSMPIQLKRGGSPRTATAMACDLKVLESWAERATSAELQAVKAARCENAALLRGAKLPSLAGAIRLSGERLLIPLGFTVEGELPDAVLLSALGVGVDELAILNADHVEIVPAAALQPLTRAGVRQATA